MQRKRAKGKSVHFYLSVPARMYERLVEVAEREGYHHVNEAIRDAIAEFVMRRQILSDSD